jgi:mannitol-1-/sugar-/sorbitol-6-phosphatase
VSHYRLACASVLFDCDGVLVDSDASVDRAWTRWAARYGLDPDRVAEMVHGRRAADSVRILVEPAQRAEALTVINTYELEDAGSVTPVAGATELVAQIPDGSWAVVTSGTRRLAHARLAAAGIAVPRVCVTADDVADGKPAPDGYLAAATALGVSPGDAIVAEDSVSGIEAGRRAGVGYVLGVGARARGDDADIVVSDLRWLRWDLGLVVPAGRATVAKPTLSLRDG